MCMLRTGCAVFLGERTSKGGEYGVMRGKSKGSGSKASSLLGGWAQEVTWPCCRFGWDGIWLPLSKGPSGNSVLIFSSTKKSEPNPKTI